MNIKNKFVGYFFNLFDCPIRFIYCRAGVLSRILNSLMFWRLYASNFYKLDENFENLNSILKRAKISIKDKIILELGPGNSYINAYNFLINGAKEVILVDKFSRRIKTAKQKRFFSSELVFVKDKYGLNSLNFIKDNIEVDNNFIKTIDKDLTEISPEEIGQVDLIYSISVLEHIKKVEENIAKMRKVLKNGGYMFHAIDMRDHYNFERPFLFYKYPDIFWENYMIKEGLSYTNRWRYEEFKQEFRKNNFLLVDEKKKAFPLTEKKITSRFKNRKDLDTGFVEFLFKK